MAEWSSSLTEFMSLERALALTRAIIILMVGMVMARSVSTGVERLAKKRMTLQQTMLLRKVLFYSLTVLVLVTVLRELGFKLSVLLGAAGILTVALGFASQTSASNLISGLFLIVESPFKIGDIITIDGTTGEVLSIDLLSVKIRTFNNLYVRIPNENIIKSKTTTLTRFPIRRIDLQLGVAYKEKIARVKKVLFKVADKNPLCLDEPKPLFIFTGFGDSALTFQFSVWTRRENFLDLRNMIYEEIKVAFDEEGIEIPFPHRTLYTGSITDPFPVRVVTAS
ncbi:mechanosensitive ion channel family protein [Acidobacteriota bacterium]